tara:strand:- start:8226 stop:8375 length:150 start_codon:yes stop_codon:yes gene_type:complete
MNNEIIEGGEAYLNGAWVLVDSIDSDGYAIVTDQDGGEQTVRVSELERM